MNWTAEAEKVKRAIERAEANEDYFKAAELAQELIWINSNTNAYEE